MDDDSNPSSPSSKNKFRSSLCFSCCFRRRTRHHLPLHSPPPLRSPSDNNPSVIWVKAKGPHCQSLSEIKEKCRSMLGISGTKHKRHGSAEFRYDPLSYALNFEDGFDFDDEAPLKPFSSRLPPSPPIPTAVS